MDPDLALDQLDQEILALKRRRSELLRERPREAVASYAFETQKHAVSLSELFDGRPDLLVIHNMGRTCAYCTLWADGLNGLLPQLESRCAIALCSPDSPTVQAQVADARGWRFRMVQDVQRKFTEAMGFWKPSEGYWPGVSAFRQDPDRSIWRVARAFFGPGDDFCLVWPLFDLLHGGAGAWEPQSGREGRT